MKTFLIALFAVISITSCKTEKKITSKASVNWLSIEEAQQKMKTEPKKVLIDIYADWCGPCKRMSKYTFTDKKVVDLINDKFYAVKFNAESTADVKFLEKTYKNKGRTHDFAIKLGSTSRGLSFPTIIYFDEDFKKIEAVPGYYQAQQYTTFLKYFGNDHYKTTTLEKFSRKN